MKRIVAALIGIVATSWGGGSVAQSASPTITVAAQGVRIISPPPGGDDALRAFNYWPGTTVALVVSAPEGGLVVFDDGASRLKSFGDDKGKDLTKPEPGLEAVAPASWGFGVSAPIGKDRKYCGLEINVPGIPSKGASALALSGTLVFKIAKEKKGFTTEKVALHAGTKVDAGKIQLTISRVGKPRFSMSGNPFEIEFHAKQSLDAITRMRFFDATGKEIESEQGGRSSTRSFDGGPASEPEETIEYELKSAVDTAKIVITCWTDMKEVAVPLDLKAGLGL
jgi:hypothetical protein